MIAHLTGYAPIAGEVGKRVYGEGLMDQGSALPCITVQRIDGRDEHQTQSGRSGTERSRWQVNAFGARGCDAVRVATLVVNALDGYKGMLGGAGGVKVGRCARVDRGSLGRLPDSNIFGHHVDFYVLAVEELP